MSRRIAGYDLARALAVFGMVAVNFKVVLGAGKNGPSWLVIAAGLLDGRAAATFVVLAGIGLSLLSRKAYEAALRGEREPLARDRATLLKRALFLFVLGSLYTAIWPADILHFYGVYIAVAAFLLATPTRRLWSYAGLLVVAFVALLLTLDYERGWDWSTLSYDGLWSPAGMVRHLFFNGFHPVVPWLAFLLVGMAIGRLEMRSATTRRRVLLWGVGVAAIAELLSAFLSRALTAVSPAEAEVVEALFGTEPMPPMPLYMLAGAGTACAVIAACVALGERFAHRGWLRPWVATGQLALTLYVGHVVVGMGALQLFGRLENQTLPFAMAAAALFCVVGVLFAHLWRLRFQRGPLEAIMRALTDPRPSGG